MQFLSFWSALTTTSGLGNTRGFYCNSNSGGSELQGIGHFLSPQELHWKELVRSSKAQKELINVY